MGSTVKLRIDNLHVDDRALYDEMIETFGELTYTCVEKVLAIGTKEKGT